MVKLRLYYVLEDEIISGADEPLDPAGKQDKHYITAVSFPNSLVLQYGLTSYQLLCYNTL